MTPCEDDALRVHLRLEMLKLCSECIDDVLDAMGEDNWNSVKRWANEMPTMAALLCGIGVVPVMHEVSDSLCHDFIVRIKAQDIKDIDRLIGETSSNRKGKG